MDSELSTIKILWKAPLQILLQVMIKTVHYLCRPDAATGIVL